MTKEETPQFEREKEARNPEWIETIKKELEKKKDRKLSRENQNETFNN